MVDLIKGYQLYEWAELAKNLIRDRTFAVSENQVEDWKWIKFWNHELDHLNLLNIIAPKPDYLNRGVKFPPNDCIEMRVQHLHPSCICLQNKEDIKLNKAEKSTILDDILTEGLFNQEKDIREEMTIAKMEIPENQIPFIVSIFGPKPLADADISFTSCLA